MLVFRHTITPLCLKLTERKAHITVADLVVISVSSSRRLSGYGYMSSILTSMLKQWSSRRMDIHGIKTKVLRIFVNPNEFVRLNSMLLKNRKRNEQNRVADSLTIWMTIMMPSVQTVSFSVACYVKGCKMV